MNPIEYKTFLELFEHYVNEYNNFHGTDYPTSPATIMDYWEETIEEGEEGYEETVWDWDEALSVRHIIQFILDRQNLYKNQYFLNFKNKIKELDQRLINLSVEPDVNLNEKEWWYKIILKKKTTVSSKKNKNYLSVCLFC